MTLTPLTILKLDSSGRMSDSVSRHLNNRLVERINLEIPGSSVITRDVAEGLPVITEDWIGANFTAKIDRSPEQKDVLKLSDELVAELHAADVLAIGLPLYNFSVPAALKTWIDLITRVGETFQYGENGSEGLLNGKRAIVTYASGGVPMSSPVDFATPYFTHMLNFIGITDITFVSGTNPSTDYDTALKSAETQIDAIEIDRQKAA